MSKKVLRQLYGRRKPKSYLPPPTTTSFTRQDLKSGIKKRGSLEAVYRHIIKRLAGDDHRRGIKRGIWDHVLKQMGA